MTGRAATRRRRPTTRSTSPPAPAGPPPALVDQLAAGGRLVIPLVGRGQYLIRLRRSGTGVEREQFEKVSFVPLVDG